MVHTDVLTRQTDMAQKKTDTSSQKAMPKKTAAVKKETKGRFDDILNILEKQKKAILKESGPSLETDLSSADETPSDMGDRASVETDQNCVLRLFERDQNLLKKIEEALDRIKDDTFGTCEVCGGEIALKRLKARPVTTLCIDCKTTQEMEEKLKLP
jgi:DnaK suppressor protein